MGRAFATPTTTVTSVAQKRATAQQLLLSRCHLGWCKKAELPVSWQQQISSACHGVYVHNILPTEIITDPTSGDQLVINALQNSRKADGTITLAGSVLFRQNDLHLQSEQGFINPLTGAFGFFGNVTGYQSAMTLRLSSITGTIAATASLLPFHDAHIVQGQLAIPKQHIWLDFMRLEQQGEAQFTTTDSRVSICTPEDPIWYLHADSIAIDFDEGLLYARNITFNLFEVPVFYLPYSVLPINDKRRSGFLYPKLNARTSDNLVYAVMPWYWNIAPQMDATVYAQPQLRHQQQSDMLLEVEGRFLREQQSGEVYAGTTSGATQQLMYSLQYRANFANTTVIVDYSKSRFANYYDTPSSLNINTHEDQQVLWQRILVTTGNEQWNLELLDIGYQELQDTTLAESSFALKPRITGHYRWESALGYYATIAARHARFVTDPNDAYVSTNIPETIYKRTIAQAETGFYRQSDWWHFAPSVAVINRRYTGSDVLADADDYQDTIVQARAHMALYFERTSDQWHSVLTPQLLLNYTAAGTEQNQLPLLDSGRKPFSTNLLTQDRLFDGFDRFANRRSVALLVRNDWHNMDSSITISGEAGQMFFIGDAREVLAKPGDAEEQYQNQQNTSPIYAGLHLSYHTHHQLAIVANRHPTKNLFTHLASFYNYLYRKTGFYFGNIEIKSALTGAQKDNIIQSALSHAIAPQWLLYVAVGRNSLAQHSALRDVLKQSFDTSLLLITCCLQFAVSYSNTVMIDAHSVKEKHDHEIQLTLRLQSQEQRFSGAAPGLESARRRIWGYNYQDTIVSKPLIRYYE